MEAYVMSATKSCSFFRTHSSIPPLLPRFNLKTQKITVHIYQLHVHRKPMASSSSLPFPTPVRLCSASLQVSPVIEDGFSSTSNEDVDLIGNQSTEQGPQTKVKLVLEKACRFGEGFYVVGNHPVLGDWNVDAAVPMDWSEGHIWSAEVDLPVQETLEFKYILKGENSDIEWQAGCNRKFETTEGVSFLVVNEPWEFLEVVDSVVEETSNVEDATDVLIDGLEVVDSVLGESINFQDSTKDSVDGLEVVGSVTEEAIDFEDSTKDLIDLSEETDFASDQAGEISNTSEPLTEIIKTVGPSSDILETSEPNIILILLDATNTNEALGVDATETVMDEANGQDNASEEVLYINGISSGTELETIGSGEDVNGSSHIAVETETMIAAPQFEEVTNP